MNRETRKPYIPIELWRDIEGYPGYEVSNMARIRDKTSGHIKLQGSNGHSLLIVMLKKDGKYRWARVKNIMARAWLPNPHCRTKVEIVNGDWRDCSLNNLRWGKRKTTRRQTVRQYRDGVMVAEYESVMAAARANGIRPNTLYACLYSRTRTTHGCRWEYVKQ